MKTLKSKSQKTTAPAPAVKTPAAKAPTTTSTIPPREITSESIASRAYSLWEQQGCPQGRDLELWLQAENQIKQASQSFAA